MTEPAKFPTPQEQLSQLFGSYKAEWLKEQMFDLYTEPGYFPELTTARPCMLLGGRGTGKTTVFRCMSYEGQFTLRGRKPEDIPNWPYYGLYYRVNTNRVTAFKGPELSEDRWIRIFAHYFNLILCDPVLRFLQWYHLHCPASIQIGPDDCSKVALSLHLPPVGSIRELADNISTSQVKFEAYINNVADNEPFPLSMQGAPVDALLEAILRLPQFQGKNFFFLLDEYENFEDYQQQVVNTLIKHSGQPYTFKIGVKELGWRRRTTLNENEQLISPADYVRIPIVEKLEGKRFVEFALNVCNDRISRLQLPTGSAPDTKKLLPGLSDEEEAEILDSQGDQLANEAASQLERIVSSDESPVLREVALLQKYFLCFWAESQKTPLEDVWRSFRTSSEDWETRYQNYKHALLYTLRRGKRGIQKYYAGWDVFTQLAAGNIRYFLELVDQSLLLHLHNDGSLTQPVPPRTQTLAAQGVGKKNLAELEGLSVHGAQLTKLLLGLGRVFQTMAADVSGHTPEVNQFHLTENHSDVALRISSTSQEEEVDRLLKSAVMHLALLRSPGNKLVDETDTRDYDYMVHPNFSAFFVFSYRRKRKMMLSAQDLLGLVKTPKKTIREILSANNRNYEEPLPEQLLLFEPYYRADS